MAPFFLVSKEGDRVSVVTGPFSQNSAVVRGERLKCAGVVEAENLTQAKKLAESIERENQQENNPPNR